MRLSELDKVILLLRWVVTDGERHFNTRWADARGIQGASVSGVKAHESLSERYPGISERALDALRHEEVYDLKQYIHLRPIKPGHNVIYPVARVGWSSPRGSLTVRMRVGLFSFANGHNEPNCYGMRFETPTSWEVPMATSTSESSGGGTLDSGNHDYFHAQFVYGFDKDTSFYGKLTEPLGTTQPAFRLDAYDAPTLIVSALASLYGIAGHLRELMASTVPVDTLRMLRPIPPV